MRRSFAAALIAAAFLLPVAVRADVSPRVNRVIVTQALQQQMQNQLNTQAVRLESQQNLSRANLQAQMQQQLLQTQYLELQQQLNLMKIEMRAVSAPAHPKVPKTHQ